MSQGIILSLAKDLVIQLMSGVLEKVRLFSCYLSTGFLGVEDTRRKKKCKTGNKLNDPTILFSPLFSIILLSFSGGWTFIMDLTCVDQSSIAK